MNAQSILTRIEQDAREAAAQILRDARAKADAMQKASEAKIERERSEALEQARREALELDDRMQRMAKLDVRKALLAAKRQVLDEAFAKALSKLQAMPDGDAKAFGMRLLLGAAQGDERVVPDEASAWCDAAFIKEANAKLTEAGRPGGLTLAPETRKLGGGFVLLRGGMEVQCTYVAALEAGRMDMEADIAALLFDA